MLFLNIHLIFSCYVSSEALFGLYDRVNCYPPGGKILLLLKPVESLLI